MDSPFRARIRAGDENSAAYAVEKNPDGTLTVSLHELDWLGDPQHFDQLASKIRAAGFTAIVDKVLPGESCKAIGGSS
ncbi:hypothetical protein [Streptomyces fagopyri]|uniref:hypothetical protein n=1 Tax=Streptomyces fagopyri TaxID=2662397 RepID=UPI003408B758